MTRTKNEWMMAGATYAGEHEMSIIKPCAEFPTENLSRFSDVIPNSKANRKQWICFYESDERFEKVWDKANIYVPMLEKFDGIITPDFSMYVNMPLELQRWNCWRGRMIGNYLQRQGSNVISNIRFADDRTFDFCFDGLPRNSVLALGSLGCVKNKISRHIFEEGLLETITRLEPEALILYGPLTKEIEEILRAFSVKYIHFDCKTKVEHERRK